MANSYRGTAFKITVTPGEAALLQECFATAAQISSGFPSIPENGTAGAKVCYSGRSTAFKAVFPPVDGEEDPLTGFLLALWSDPGNPDFDAHLTIDADPGGKGKIAFIRSHETNVATLASLFQKVCKSALPFGFEWAIVCDKDIPGGFGGGYFVVTETEILGGSTHWLMRETLQTLRAGA